MATEKEKMLAGQLYDPLDPELAAARDRARELCQDLNATRERNQLARRSILKELFGRGGDSVWENVVTSCAPCNLRKGNRLPEEIEMRLLVKPRAPTPSLFVTLSSPRIPEGWQPYLSAFA